MPLILDKRLGAVAAQVEGKSVCDVGCDHGKLACFLLESRRAERAIAVDISRSCLQKAVELAKERGVTLDARLGDGLYPVSDGEADCVVIAGLGGDVIAGIIDEAAGSGKSFLRYVVSPNTHSERVREALGNAGYTITSDFCVRESGRRYPVITAKSGGGEALDELQLIFGKFYDTDAEFSAFASEGLSAIRCQLREQPGAAGLRARAELLSRALENVKC